MWKYHSSPWGRGPHDNRYASEKHGVKLQAALGIITLLLSIVCLTCSCSEQKENKVTRISGTAMTIPYHVTIGKHLDDRARHDVEQIVAAIFGEVDRLYNVYNPHSEITHINTLRAGEEHVLSEEMYQFLNKVDAVVTLTDGFFDPTVYAVHQVWRESLENSATPEMDRLEKIHRGVGWSHIHFEDGILSKDETATQLDFGGIAKGYCVDGISDQLKSLGYKNHIVEWGGELKCCGHHPSGRAWMACISNPCDTDPSHAIAHIPICNQALATSGDYFQYWEIEGEGGTKITYTHIIDPKTLRPLISKKGKLTSCSVIADSCTIADALATRAMIFETSEEAQSWAETIQQDHPSYSFWFAIRE